MNAVIVCYLNTSVCIITGCGAPDSKIQTLIDEGCNIIAQSIAAAPDAVKRILQSPVTPATATSLWKKVRVPTLKRMLDFRGESTKGKKDVLFARAHPSHAKVLPPAKKKKKTAAQKKEEKHWEDCRKRNEKIVQTLFTTFAKKQKK